MEEVTDAPDSDEAERMGAWSWKEIKLGWGEAVGVW